MGWKQNRTVIIIAVALLAVVWGVYQTGDKPVQTTARTARRSPSDRNIIVDQSSLITAEQLISTPMSAEERPFAEDAVRIADNEMDLSFASAVRRTANQPRDTSDAVREADARLQKSLRALAADQVQVATLTVAVSKANAADADALNDQLNLANAHAALDQDEVDDARLDLRRAGGDPQGRMEEMIAEHNAASKGSDSLRIVVVKPTDVHGLVHHLQALQALYLKKAQLHQARKQADSLAGILKERHDRIEARGGARGGGRGGTRGGTRGRSAAAPVVSHDSTEALLANTQQLAREGTIRATLDQRIENQKSLSNVYTGWSGVIAAQERGALNRALRGVFLILAIVLIAMLLGRWIEHILGARAGRAQTHHLAVRVSLQVVSILLIAFVIFGPPNNLGTILGLAGAGLTVALKDFILGFLGWFVLMGRNGIRIGDLVEVNGVTGEVIELGVFRTVLLETGRWTESGHPTGRRVTFNNSFAIEGHYFNFSTSGRWLWDDVRIVVPAGRDPYPIAAALQKQVEETTAESAREAEAQWSVARRSPKVSAPEAGPSVSLRPIAGGVEIAVRYITRVTEREAMRDKLYHTAVDMLGGVPSGAAH